MKYVSDSYNSFVPTIKADKRLFRKHRNPSFEGKIAPHCTIAQRYCYCETDDGIRKCEVGRVNHNPALVSTIVQPKAEGVYFKGVRRGIFGGSDLSFNELAELEEQEGSGSGNDE